MNKETMRGLGYFVDYDAEYEVIRAIFDVYSGSSYYLTNPYTTTGNASSGAFVVVVSQPFTEADMEIVKEALKCIPEP